MPGPLLSGLQLLVKSRAGTERFEVARFRAGTGRMRHHWRQAGASDAATRPLSVPLSQIIKVLIVTWPGLIGRGSHADYASIAATPLLYFKRFGGMMPLFLFIFIFLSIYSIHSFDHIHTIYLSIAICRGLSPSPHRRISSVGRPSLWCRAKNRTRACLTASRRATN